MVSRTTAWHLNDFFPCAWGMGQSCAGQEMVAHPASLRRVVTGALELARADKSIGSSLEAAPVLVVNGRGPTRRCSTASILPKSPSPRRLPSKSVADLAGLYVIPEIKGAAAKFAKADGSKMRPLLAGAGGGGSIIRTHLCKRCTDAVQALGRHDLIGKKGLEPREMGLIAAALSLVADQGFKAVHAL